MKHTPKKRPAKSSRQNAVKDLDVKRDKGGDVRGGPTAVELKALGARTSFAESMSAKVT